MIASEIIKVQLFQRISKASLKMSNFDGTITYVGLVAVLKGSRVLVGWVKEVWLNIYLVKTRLTEILGE